MDIFLADFYIVVEYNKKSFAMPSLSSTFLFLALLEVNNQNYLYYFIAILVAVGNFLWNYQEIFIYFSSSQQLSA